eukprot:5846435-Pyramimonas_sp.AAC.2
MQPHGLVATLRYGQPGLGILHCRIDQSRPCQTISSLSRGFDSPTDSLRTPNISVSSPPLDPL